MLLQGQVLFLPLPLDALVVVFLLQVPHRGPTVPLKVRLVVWGRGRGEEILSVSPAAHWNVLDAQSSHMSLINLPTDTRKWQEL